MSDLNNLPGHVETHESWLTYNDIDEDTYIHIIRSTLKHPKVFLKRKPGEHRMNAYMKGLLTVWQANHDVQFVLDPYQCVTYICDYMMKAQKGMSDLLRVAWKHLFFFSALLATHSGVGSTFQVLVFWLEL